MSLLQSLLFPQPLSNPVVARIVTPAIAEDDVLPPPQPKRVRAPRGGGKKLSASGEANIYFNEIRQSFYVLITHKGKRRGKYGFQTIAEAVVARDKFEIALKRERVYE